MKELVFIDIETTAKYGPEENKDAIIEIAASKVNLKTRETTVIVDTIIKPGGTDIDQAVCQVGGGERLSDGVFAPNTWKLGEYHIKAGHFADVDWSLGQPIKDVFNTLSLALEGATIAGQNPKFDLAYIKRDFKNLGMTFPKIDYHLIDLCSPAIFLYMAGIIPGISLRHSSQWAGCGKQQHRAGQDVKDAIEVFWKMHDYYNGKTSK